MSLSFPQRMITVEPATDHHNKDVILPRGTLVTMTGDDPKRGDGAWYTVLCDAEDGTTHSLRYRDITETEFNPDPEERIKEAIAVIGEDGCVDGSHHKQWVLNEVLRKLMGGEAFVAWLQKGYENGLDGEQYEEWDLGVAP
jgi:hypothetical protein